MLFVPPIRLKDKQGVCIHHSSQWVFSKIELAWMIYSSRCCLNSKRVYLCFIRLERYPWRTSRQRVISVSCTGQLGYLNEEISLWGVLKSIFLIPPSSIIIIFEYFYFSVPSFWKTRAICFKVHQKGLSFAPQGALWCCHGVKKSADTIHIGFSAGKYVEPVWHMYCMIISRCSDWHHRYD